MTSILRLACVLVVAAASGAAAQTPPPAADSGVADSSIQHVVTTFSVKSGRILLSSADISKPAYLPDGTYTNESDVILVILDGVIVRLQGSSGDVTEISSVHANRQRGITLTPSTNALMQVSDIRLPSGTFQSVDGRSSITVVAGRPTAFTLPAASPDH